ncbi:DUF523 domain-containing protein [Arthrobacter sp. NIO-1057]|uniref:DUF523 domain-containing protein n=1 Tax=Arthrobacter sp. NIO-1057 TaxID=993071 RepID=UPI00071C2C3B|nr:DUF523 domain-containing protein [Arthrobacter sp. NIO-1057]KSU65109.1 hypothetical protein AS038_14280 [Arthrobacter sp. NIO-1057]SCC47530.1 Uncharacterized conserved protein YbbK, DUF523 family [Arthrobacter sp. NIO-1057]
MRKVPILVSSCLAGIPCRYNGKAKTDQNIVNAVARGEAIAACAEELGDLPTPRPPAEIVGGDGYDVLQGNATVVSINGQDLTEAFVAGAQEVAQLATSNGITEAVLQDRSPSCGCGAIYDGSHSGTIVEGDGILAALLKERGLQVSARRGQ